MTAYEQRRDYLLSALESYRINGSSHDLVDRTIQLSLRAAVSTEARKLHNLIVLRYIIEKPLAKSKICRTLHIGRDNYDCLIRQGVDRLMILVFGMDGIDWR